MAETATGTGHPDRAEEAAAICTAHGNRPDELLEILHDVQASFGYVPDETLVPIASALNLTRAEVYGVLTFYHDFMREKPGRTVVRICRAECCQASGCEALAEHAEKALGIGFGETTPDGRVSLKAVYCLGNCSLGPSVLMGEELHGRVDAERFDELLAALKP